VAIIPKMFSDFRPVETGAATGGGVWALAGAWATGAAAFFYWGFFSRFPITIAIIS